MSSGANEIRLLELKDTISQLNTTISTQNELIRSMQKMLQERDAKDSEKDKLIAQYTAMMKEAAKVLDFEQAAFFRDKIKELKA